METIRGYNADRSVVCVRVQNTDAGHEACAVLVLMSGEASFIYTPVDHQAPVSNSICYLHLPSGLEAPHNDIAGAICKAI